jgi:hypothetical protein
MKLFLKENEKLGCDAEGKYGQGKVSTYHAAEIQLQLPVRVAQSLNHFVLAGSMRLQMLHVVAFIST